MSIPFCRLLRLCVPRATLLLIGLTVATGCAGTRRGPEQPGVRSVATPRAEETTLEAEPAPQEEAPIDLIMSVATAAHTHAASNVSAAFTVPAHLRNMLEAADVVNEFTHLFAPHSAADMPPVLYDAVLQFVDIYNGRARGNFATWLAREGRWGPMIREELRLAGLPEDLVYLSLVESGFSNTAVSRARATGMWQFMEGTARAVGLRVDEWVDERRDPQLATSAAIRHLRFLYRETQDWALAAAAYNAGLGRVSRIQREQGESDYFRLVAAGRLPPETRNYVPAILAAALIAHHRDRFGFGGIRPEPAFQFDSIAVEPLTRLSAVAKAAGSTERVLRELNPQLLKFASPPGGEYWIRVPYGSDPVRTSRVLASLPEAERLLPRDRWVIKRYTVRPGDGWGTIAQRHHTTIAAVRKQNPRVTALHPGMTLKIRVLQPASSESPAAARRATAQLTSRRTGPATADAADDRHTDRAASRHRVTSGETLSGLAARYGVSVAQLMAWNGMQRPRGLRIGETLIVAAPAPRRASTHTVSAGETLSGIARRYGIPLSDLARWNDMAEPRPLRVGERLRLTPPARAASESAPS